MHLERPSLVDWTEVTPSPMPGTYKMRQRIYGPEQRRLGIKARELLEIGPYVGVLIEWAEFEDPDNPKYSTWNWRAYINTKEVKLTDAWPWCAKHPISTEEYEELINENARTDRR